MLSDAERRELRQIEVRLGQEAPILERLRTYSFSTRSSQLSMYSLLWAGLILIGVGLLIRQDHCVLVGLWALLGWPIQVHLLYGIRNGRVEHRARPTGTRTTRILRE
jgi:hypothetical protein